MKRATKRDIDYASRMLAETRQISEEYRATEGNRAASAFEHSPDCAQRMSRCIGILVAAKQPLPEWLIKGWAYYRTCGWSMLKEPPNANT